MKYKLSIAMLLLAVMFASCNEENRMDEMGEGASKAMPTTLKVTASDGVQTRAAATGVDRFAIEVYTDDTYTTPATVFGSGDAATHKANNATGEFTMILDRTQPYYCLLWADKAGAGVYNIDNLKAVALTGKAAEGWQGTIKIEAGKQAVLTTMLHRAVSKISLMETGKLKAGGKLTLNLDQPTVFNVATASTSGTATARPEETIDITADKDGSTTPVKLNDTDIFVLSSVNTANLTDLTFKYNNEDAFTVSQAPLKANFNTNIKGHYTSKTIPTFNVICDESWGTQDNEGNLVSHVYGNDTKAEVPEGEGTEAAPYLLASAANIKWLQGLKTTESKDKYFKLMTDIKVTSDTWTPIGDSQDSFFEGCFDGNGHKFTGKLTAQNIDWNFGIFAVVYQSATVKNLINEAEVYAPNCVGVGGITGGCDGVAINCKNTGKITGKYYVGGIVGSGSYKDSGMTTGTKSVISGCENSGEIIASGTENVKSLLAAAGGIVGGIYFVPSSATGIDASCLVENCKNTGNVSALVANSKFAGGILGYPRIENGTCEVTGCTNTGTVKSENVLATENIGDNNKPGLLVGGQSSNGGTVVIKQ